LEFSEEVAPKYDQDDNIVFSVVNDGVGVYSAIIEKQKDFVWPFLTTAKKNYPLWEEINLRFPE
jgi:hypothetical protein